MDIAILLFVIACFTLLLEIHRKLRPARRVRHRIVIDTSTLMDGRVVELARTGFLQGELLVSKRVVGEMQTLADSGSSQKRERARLGLDVLQELQANESIQVKLVEGNVNVPVDDELRTLATRYRAQLMTNDFNLAKVAQVDGIHVLNINELAQSLRPTRLPGERIDIKIVQKGAERQQGVGYLEDGTMVVVEDGARKVGRIVPVIVTRTLQTAAGKMCFAESAKN
jgi:uncharacterized protein YacL